MSLHPVGSDSQTHAPSCCDLHGPVCADEPNCCPACPDATKKGSVQGFPAGGLAISPEPWAISDFHDTTIMDAQKRSIADVYKGIFFWQSEEHPATETVSDISHNEAKANARLMVAAPKLYAALLSVCHECERGTPFEQPVRQYASIYHVSDMGTHIECYQSYEAVMALNAAREGGA